MTWWTALPALLGTVCIVMLPGLAVSSTLRLPEAARWAAAAPLTAAAAGLGAICFEALGLGWGLLQLLISAFFLAALAWGLRAVAELWGPPLPHPALGRRGLGALLRIGPGTAWYLGCSAAASLVLGAVFMVSVSYPQLLAQAHDNIFHAPAVQHILDTGHGSSLTLGTMANAPSISFYPAAWHDLAAVVAASTGSDVPVAMNLLNLVLMALVWPLSLLFLIQALFGDSKLSALCGAAVAGAFPIFPYLPLQFGVIYPFLMALALLPALLGAAVTAAAERIPGVLRLRLALFLVLSAPGILLAHPSMLHTALLMLAPWALSLAWRLRGRAFALPSLLLVIGWAAAMVWAWGQLRSGRGASVNWNRYGDTREALWDLWDTSPLGYPASAALSVLIWTGFLLVLLRPRLLGRLLPARAGSPRWLAFSFLGLAAAFVLGQMRQNPDLRWVLTGVWYNDYFRISTMMALAALPLAALALMWWADILARTVQAVAAGFRQDDAVGRGASAQARLPLITHGATALAALLLLVPGNPAIRHSVLEAQEKYALTQQSLLVDSNEMALFQYIREHLPPGTLMAGDPLTGAGLAAVYADAQLVQPTNSPAPTADGRYVMANLDQLTQDGRVCQAVHALRLKYVLDFGHNSVHGYQRTYRPGFMYLDSTHGFELIARYGDARLLKITGCGED